MSTKYMRLLQDYGPSSARKVETINLKVKLTAPDGLESFDSIAIQCTSVEGLVRFTRLRLAELEKDFKGWRVEIVA